jgi:hypothetical protein
MEIRVCQKCEIRFSRESDLCRECGGLYVPEDYVPNEWVEHGKLCNWCGNERRVFLFHPRPRWVMCEKCPGWSPLGNQG